MATHHRFVSSPVSTAPRSPVDAGRLAARARFARSDGDWERRRRAHPFYYEDLYRFVRRQVEPGARVLDLGCGDGALLASLRPSFGVGVDLSEPAIRRARRLHPELHFVCGDIERLPMLGAFDYVIVSNAVGYLLDVWAFFRGLATVVHPGSRVVVTYYNFLWEPVVKAAEALGLKVREPLQNWLSNGDIRNLLELADFEAVASGHRTPVPGGPPRLAGPINRALGALPGVERLGITSYVIARPRPSARGARVLDPTCSVVVPTRNERENVRPLIDRLPRLGSRTEVVFVDGGSTDGTARRIERAIEERPDVDIRLVHQGTARGKGDAVRRGFQAATGDVLMILDADLTVAPEDLEKFFAALVEERGELINGTRLVYPMERQAMRLANIAGNKLFGLVFSWILRQRITDTLCGTKVLWADDYRRLAARRSRFGLDDPFGDFDLLFGAAAMGLRIREVPVRYRERTYGSTNIRRWRHGLLLLRMAARGAVALRLR